MDNKSVSNLEFLNMTQNKKVVPSIEKIKWEFTKKYVFIALIAFIIYILTFNIINDQYIKLFNNSGYNMSSVEEYIKNRNTQTNQILIISILLIFCNFLVVFLSSILIFNKYKIKKEDISNVMRTIIIIQLIFIAILSFHFSITYVNETRLQTGDSGRIQKLLANTIHDKNNLDMNYKVNQSINVINNLQLTKLITLIIVNFICSTICIWVQGKIMKNNSI